MRARCLALSLAALTAVSVPLTASAQQGGTIDLEAFRPAIDSRGYITVNASQILGHLEFSFGLVTSWGWRVLELTGPTTVGTNVPVPPADGSYRATDETSYTIEHLITPNLQAAVGLFKVLEIGANIPFHVVSGNVGPDYMGTVASPNTADEFSFGPQGIGDLGLHAKVRILDTSRNPVGLAVMGSVYLPLGERNADEPWLGEKKLSFLPSVIVDKELGRFKFGANLGIRIRTAGEDDRSFVNSATASAGSLAGIPGTGETVTAPASDLPFGLGASFAIVQQRFDLLAEILGAVPMGGDNYMPLEAIAGVKLYLAKNSFFMFGGGAGLSTGASAANPDARAFIGIVFEPNIGDRDGDGIKDDVDQCPDEPEDFDDFEDSDGCPDPDNDRDGILDDDDKCPNEPEDKDGIEDEDGCPDGDTLDRDGDGIPDDTDQCPDDPEDKDGFQDEDGCPDTDNDQDGILDVDDLCPNDPEDKDEWEDQDGCPDADNDKDRILDKDDACPNEPETYNGKDDEDGCPDKGRVIVTTGSIEILDKIYFETNKAIIKPISFPILDAIAATLQGNPDIMLIEVGGHADERGQDEHNLRLTQDRSEAVRKYLVDKGVDDARLKAVGYGETRPVDPRHNEEAWSKNRRVEFIILKRAGQP